MANSSSTSAFIQSTVKNELGLDFDIDASTNCDIKTEAGNKISGLTITGSEGVDIKQASDVKSLCQAKSLMDLKAFTDLSNDAKNDILRTLNQEGGLPGANISSSNTQIMNQIENEVSLKAKIDMAQKCFSELNVPNVLEDVTIQDAKDINIEQVNTGLNECIFNTATEIAQEQGLQLDTAAAVKEDVTQKGWDPIESVGGLVGSLGLLAVAPAIISIVIVISSSVMMGASGMMGQGQGAPGGLGDVSAPPIPSAPQLGGALSKVLGVTSKSGKRLITLLIKIVLIVGLAWILYKIFSPKKRSIVNERYTNININTPVPQRTNARSICSSRFPVRRNEYHQPHILSGLNSGGDCSFGCTNDIPEYVKRWY